MFGIREHSSQGDPRVTQALEALNIKFEFDEEGDYRLGTLLPDGRTQIGFIRARTFEFAGVEMREVFSVGLRSFGPFDPRTCNILLQENSSLKIGAWAVVSNTDDVHLAIFSVKVAADLAGPTLGAVIAVVLKTADDMEQRLAGRDDF